MATEFKFPDVGEGITEGHLIKWLVKQGQTVKADQPIAEVETDKAVVELPAPVSGKILKLHAEPGQMIKVGALLATIGGAGEKASAGKPGKAKAAAVPEKAAARAAQKPGAGKRESVSVVGEVPAGSRIITRPAEAGAEKTLALPAVRKLALALGIELSGIRGTGKGGRITENDVRAAVAGAKIVPAAPELPAAKITAPKIGFDSRGRVLRIPISPTRRAIIKRLSLAHAVPVATGMADADITELSKIRKSKKETAEKRGIHLTFLPFIARAAVIALKKHPYINSEVDIENAVIVNKSYYNIGIAVATPHGLMVPVVKNADSKSIMEIAHNIELLAEGARNKSLSLEEMRGSTFSITNYGSIGTNYAVPVLNYPETAVLGVGRAEDKPVVRDGQIVIRKILPLSLTFDHRVVDGAEAALFLNEIIRHLEDPQLLLVDMD